MIAGKTKASPGVSRHALPDDQEGLSIWPTVFESESCARTLISVFTDHC